MMEYCKHLYSHYWYEWVDVTVLSATLHSSNSCKYYWERPYLVKPFLRSLLLLTSPDGYKNFPYSFHKNYICPHCKMYTDV